MMSNIADDSRVSVPFKTVLASIVGLWLCYFLLTTIRSEIHGFGFPLELMLRRALACAAGIGATLMLWAVLRLFDPRPLWMKIAAALLLSVPVSVLLVKSNELAFRDMEERASRNMVVGRGSLGGDPLGSDPLTGTGGSPADSSEVIVRKLPLTPVQDLVENAFGRYFMMLAWCALYLALLTGEKARAAERREGAYRRAAKAAELRSLRYQVNPHFLFNTLNSLSALVLTGRTETAERMIQTISTFYRRSLADDPTADVPLHEEFELQKLYLEVEAVRFPNRLEAKFDLPDELREAEIPGMILQPLVENSVKHAVATSSDRVTLSLTARLEYGRLVVTVADNGRQTRSPDQPPAGFGIGLANVRERLEARFGRDASVVSGPVPGGYATVLRLPLIGRVTREAA